MSETKEKQDDLQQALSLAQIEKVNLEIENLKRGKGERRLVRYLPLVTTLIAVAGFLFGIYQFESQQNERLRTESVAKEREFKKALWERQLSYYLEAARAAATLATFNKASEADIQPEITKARLRFWQLYYGELAVIEDQSVSKAMVKYGRCLRDYDLHVACDQDKLKEDARLLAQECRQAVAKSWHEELGEAYRP